MVQETISSNSSELMSSLKAENDNIPTHGLWITTKKNFLEAFKLHSYLLVKKLQDNLEFFSQFRLLFSSTLDVYRFVSSAQLNEGSMASHCLTQDGLGKDSRFLSIYFVCCS